MLSSLFELVPPPDTPVNTGSADEWRCVLEAIRQELPNELFELNSAYGSGHFMQDEFSIEIHSVFRPAFAMMVDFNRLVFAQEATSYPDPYSNMFELGAYGFGDEPRSSGRLFWDTSGPLEKWSIGMSRPLQRHPMSLVDFLVRCFSNQMHPAGFPESFTSLRFVPWNRPALIDSTS